jgi:hypothetical protein
MPSPYRLLIWPALAVLTVPAAVVVGEVFCMSKTKSLGSLNCALNRARVGMLKLRCGSAVAFVGAAVPLISTVVAVVGAVVAFAGAVAFVGAGVEVGATVEFGCNKRAKCRCSSSSAPVVSTDVSPARPSAGCSLLELCAA